MSAEALLASGDCKLFSGCGFPAPGIEIFFPPYVPLYGSFELFGVTFDISKYIVLLALTVVLIIAFAAVAYVGPKLVPGRAQGLGELLYGFVKKDIVEEVIGHDGMKYLPFLMSLFLFVWLNNVWGIIPGAQLPVNASLAFPAALAIMVWFTYMIIGIRKQGPIGFFKNMMFPPGLPPWLYIILAPIELISNVLVRPFTMAVRLFANMFAGHLLIVTFALAFEYLFLAPAENLQGFVVSWGGAIASFAVMVGLTGFEVLIQLLQAFIFTLLAAVYISTSLSEEH